MSLVRFSQGSQLVFGDTMDTPHSVQIPALRTSGVRKCVNCLIGLTVLGMVGVVAGRALFGRDNLLGLSQRFDPRFEGTVHAWLGSLLLGVCAAALAVIASDERTTRFRKQWWVLSLGFLFLSADELLQMHEGLSKVTKAIFGSGSAPHLWALIGLVGAAGLFVAYLPFLRHLSPHFRKRFILAGAVYLGGAIGFELLGAVYGTLVRPNDRYYVSLAVIEETLELVGCGMFLMALLEYIGARQAEGARG